MRSANGPRETEGAARAGDGADLIEVGVLVGCHGVRGEMRMRLHNPTSAALDSLPPVHLRAADGASAPCQITAARPHKQGLLVKLEGVATIEQAQGLVGRAVCIRRDQLPPAGPDEFYHTELIGCAVSTDAGESLGTVREVIATGSNDVCVVRGRGREYLIPLVADVIAHIDPATRVIVVRPLPGLLDE